MKALAISGGATKISFLGGAAIELMIKNDYQIITGISAGSIVTLLLAIEEYDTLRDAIFNTTEDDFFDVSPTTKSGNVSMESILRIIMGKHSLGKYCLDDLLKTYYTPEMHQKMINCGKIVKIGAVNLNLVRIEYCDITTVDYDTAIKWVVASSSIPVTTETVKIGEHYYVDGGMLEHVGGLEALNSGATSLDVVFSRPEKLELTEKDIEWKPYNVFGVILRVLGVMSRNTTLDNEDEIKHYCINHNIPLNIFYTPFMLTTSLYKMEVKLSKTWFQLGKEMILKGDNSNEYHSDVE